jgi:uncharacterized phage protein gp47/JayE
MDVVTRLDLYAIGRDYVVQRAKKIDPTMVDVEGSDVNVFVGSGSVMSFAVMKQLLYAVNRLFLDGCEDEDLDRYAWDRYQTTRKGASPALGAVRFYRANATAGSGTIPIGTKLRTTTGIEYVTTSVASFGASDLVSKANVRAVQAGKATQVGANYIRQFASPAAIFDRIMQVNNDKATAGGEDIENDSLFKDRLRDFWRTARRGILAAIEVGAKTVPGVVSAQAIEALTDGGLPARLVSLYIADSSGVASDALAQQVKTALDDYRAGGIYVSINTSIPTIVNIVLKLVFAANVDTNTLSDNIRASVVEYINSLPVNGTLTLGGIYAVLQRFVADGLILSSNTIQSPAADIVPAVGQTLRTTLTNVIPAAA